MRPRERGGGRKAEKGTEEKRQRERELEWETEG